VVNEVALQIGLKTCSLPRTSLLWHEQRTIWLSLLSRIAEPYKIKSLLENNNQLTANN
jgi:hypothetical protein